MSEVAELTASRAVMKAAAKAVAVSRLGEKVANIVWSLFLLAGPSVGPRTHQCTDRAKSNFPNEISGGRVADLSFGGIGRRDLA